MNRKQRRAREKSIRLNQKAARKAALPDDATQVSVMSDACIDNAKHALHFHEHHGAADIALRSTAGTRVSPDT
jgi:hypothetical protein